MRVSECAGACSPCVRGVRSPESCGDSATRSVSPALLRCGSRGALARALAAPTPCPRRGAAGLGASLRSSSSQGLLRLWPRARPRAGCDCPDQIGPPGEPWRPYLTGPPCPRCNLGGEAVRESAVRACCASAGAAGANGPALAANARVDGRWELARTERGRCRWASPPSPHLSRMDFGAGRKRRKGVSRRASVRP